MDASELHELIDCPHCGAKLPPADASGTRTCEYCESAYRATVNPAPPPAMAAPPDLGGWSAVSSTMTPPANAMTISSTRSSSGCGVVGVVVLVLIVAAVAIPVYLGFRSGTFTKLLAAKPAGKVGLSPAATNGTPLFTLTRASTDSGSSYSMIRLDAPNASPTWTGPALSSTSAAQAPILSDGNLVFIPDGPKVVAFRADNGTQAWVAPLADEFSNSCKDCFFLAGSRLVVESTDSTYQAFDPTTGALAWSRKAVDVSAHAAPFGDQTLLLDDDEKHDGVIVLINPDGSEASRLQPTCPYPGSRSSNQKFDNDASVVLLPGENAAVFGYGSYPCWQRIDFATGQPAWTSTLDNSSYPAGRSDTVVVTQGNKAAIVGGKYIASLDLGTGDYKPVSEVADTELYPLGLRENTLLLRTAGQRGTKRYGIHAVDLASGQETWSVDLGKAEPADGPGSSTIFLSTGDARFTTSLDGDTFHVVVFDQDSRQLQVDNIAVSTGKETKSSVDSGIGDSLPHFTPAGWQGPIVVISFDDAGVVVLDTTSARITYRYP